MTQNTGRGQNRKNPCADPEIFMRGGPTKMVIFGHRRGGGGPTPQTIPKLPFLGKISKFQGGGSGPPVPPLDPRMKSILIAEGGNFIAQVIRDHKINKQWNYRYYPLGASL